ncbi:hypothetical protein ACJMK2_022413 [Sinanodonta woodiana]|uniref:Uncharacterized protein n=1 Tax=Sinanodonta woodiana TaxID=1069815 RepID=A0ABD3TKZ5_SINWO
MKNMFKCLFWTGLFLSMDTVCECIIIKSIHAIRNLDLTTTDMGSVSNSQRTVENTRFGAWGGKRSVKIDLNKSLRFHDNPVWPVRAPQTKRPFTLMTRPTHRSDDYYTFKLARYGHKSHDKALPMQPLNKYVENRDILKRAASYHDGYLDGSEGSKPHMFAALWRALDNIVNNADNVQRAVNMKDVSATFQPWGGK